MLVRLLLIFISLLTIYLWSNINKYKLYWKLGGPFGLPFLGNVLKFMQVESFLKNFSEFESKHGSPYCCWLGSICFVVISDPDAMQTILTSENCTTKTFFYKFLSKYIGDGLFTSSPPKWNNRVKFIKPVFKNKVLESYYPEFNKQGDYFLQIFSENMENKNFSIFNILKNVTLNITLQTLVGDYSKNKIDETDEILLSVESMKQLIIIV
ncbi:probable cytochrome P450 313b1 [Condylostylus longicornis]|uniref:probable cytochrome P450 313b1 n=1 Tax=Condylostylus longicornis TaxID=2530218 RepID=UPI00244E308E|nr:probable cytochrome P450 313b1 [Condylostylus longicornis]